MKRIRTCESCGKQLGGTTAKCFECGGTKPSPSRSERLTDARTWKTLGGIPHEYINEAHDGA